MNSSICNKTLLVNATWDNGTNHTPSNCSLGSQQQVLSFGDSMIIFGVLTLALIMASVNVLVMSNFCRCGTKKKGKVGVRMRKRKGRRNKTFETGFSGAFEEVVSGQHYPGERQTANYSNLEFLEVI